MLIYFIYIYFPFLVSSYPSLPLPPIVSTLILPNRQPPPPLPPVPMAVHLHVCFSPSFTLNCLSPFPSATLPLPRSALLFLLPSLSLPTLPLMVPFSGRHLVSDTYRDKDLASSRGRKTLFTSVIVNPPNQGDCVEKKA